MPDTKTTLEEGDAIYDACQKLAVELVEINPGSHPDYVANALFDFASTLLGKDLIRRANG